MEKVQIFNHNEFGELRKVTKNGQDWLVGKDVAEALGYADASRAVYNHVDKADKEKITLQAHCQNGNVVKTQMTIVNESGLYSLILSSKLPQAKEFKRWVTSEVLPSIRATGSYNAIEAAPLALPEQKAEAEAVPSALPLLQEFNKTLQLAHRLQRDCNIKAYKVLRMAQNMLEGVR